jgi:hypothetical protein
VVNRPCRKLARKYFGPFSIEQKFGSLAYKLKPPVNSRIHPVFHVSQLKPYTPDYTPVFADLPKPPDLTKVDVEPEVILECRMMKKGDLPVVQMLVKWSTLPESAATWEDYEVLRRRYPDATIWEGAAFQGEDNVTLVPDIANDSV